MTLLFVLIAIVLIIIIGMKVYKYYMLKEISENEVDEQIAAKKQYKKISTIVTICLVAGIGIATVLSSVFITNEQQVACVNTLGKVSNVEGAGMHLKVPFISKVYKEDSTAQGIAIGYDEGSDESKEEDSLMITSDFNLVNIDFYIEYRIIDLVDYKYGSSDPTGILKDVAKSAIRNTVGQDNVDSVLTTGKAEIESKVFEDILQELENHSLGVTILNVTIQDSEPPTKDVNNAFKAVENAKQSSDTSINEAIAYKNTKIPEAEAAAEAIKQKANATKTERINSAKEQVATFNALYDEYQKNPSTVKNRLYYETLSNILPKMEIVIADDGSKVVYVAGDTKNVTDDTTTKTDTKSDTKSDK